MGSASTYNPPCAACKFLRRKCIPSCIFASYFPPEEPHKFANVHKIFGASNVAKLLNELEPHQRDDAVNSLAYEAEARVRDPVYGCVGAISYLQKQVDRLQKELDAANSQLIRFACNNISVATPRSAEVNRRFGSCNGGGVGTFYRTTSVPVSYHGPWNDIYSNYGEGIDGGSN